MTIVPPGKGKPVMCPFCKQKNYFKRKRDCTTHIRIAHGKQAANKWRNMDIYKNGGLMG